MAAAPPATGRFGGVYRVHSMDSILADEPSVHTLPESDDSSTSHQSTSVDSGASNEGTKSSESTAPATGDGDIDDTSDPDPVDLTAAGLRKALSAARRDKREERKRARELQRHLDQLTGHVSALQRQPQAAAAPQPEAKKPEDENDAFYIRGADWTKEVATRAADERTRKAEERIAAVEHAWRMQRMNDVEEAFLERHDDAKEAIGFFGELAAQDPALHAEFRAVVDGQHKRYRNPAKFAYEYAKAYQRAQQYADPGYEQKQRAQWEAERTGQSTGSRPPPKPPTKTPKSLADARGSGVAIKQAWSGPRSLSDILR